VRIEFAKAILSHPDAMRSSCPVNSKFVNDSCRLGTQTMFLLSLVNRSFSGSRERKDQSNRVQ
jgi:hypothetical protein